MTARRRRHSLPMSVPLYSRFLSRIEHEQRKTPTIILHYDSHSRDLRVWFWYAFSHVNIVYTEICLRRPVSNIGVRVPPTDLFDYRSTHDFKTPCCLCACKAYGSYTETAIFRALDGPYAGEYVASCASGSCGYMGM